MTTTAAATTSGTDLPSHSGSTSPQNSHEVSLTIPSSLSASSSRSRNRGNTNTAECTYDTMPRTKSMAFLFGTFTGKDGAAHTKKEGDANEVNLPVLDTDQLMDANNNGKCTG